MPAITVRFHRLATREYLQAKNRYAQASLALAESFAEELDKAVKQIEENPTQWPRFGRSSRWV